VRMDSKPSLLSSSSALSGISASWLLPLLNPQAPTLAWTGGFTDFSSSVWFFLNSAVEEEFDLFFQRPMLLFREHSWFRS
jgi:hypothetical protein